ncbi:MAG: hypothetical protein P1R58_08895, partial [bacterium]|nr:hypothetical protein [bacterium]
MTFRNFLVMVALMTILSPSLLSASMISYQGRLTSAGGAILPDSTYSAEFRLYPDSILAAPVWSETANIVTANGLFSHMLGSVVSLPVNLTTESAQLFLEIQIGGESLGPKTRLAASPYSLSAANLLVRDSSDSVTIFTDPNRGSLSLINPTSRDTTVVLRPDIVGDSSVLLPEGSISSLEMGNEPGATWNFELSLISLGTGDMSDLVGVSVEIPEEGYIMLYGKCYVMLSGTTGANGAQIQIDLTQGGVGEFPYYQQVGMSGFVNTGLNYFPIMTTRIYYLPAGSYDFRLEGLATH